MSATPTAEAETIRSSDDVKYSVFGAFREFMRFGSPRIMGALVVVMLTGKILTGGWSWWDALVPVLIVALWPIQEWLVHVFLLHLKPRKLGPITFDTLAARKHRAHHSDPWNLIDVFVPVPVVVASGVVLGTLWWFLAPSPQIFFWGSACYALMAYIYEWTHYLIHSRYRPKTSLFKHLWKHHRLHHCKNENYWFGLTMTSGDIIFRTAPDPKDVETSPTCQDMDAR